MGLMDHDNAAGISDNFTEIDDNTARIGNIAAKVINAKLRREWSLE